MKELVENKEIIKKYALALRKTVEKDFSWEVTAKKILNDMEVK